MVYIYPTIDTEGVHGSRPFEQFILGEVGEKEDWGALRLARIFKEFDVSATFFVDCYEYTYWGEDKMSKLCQGLEKLSQDVQLHTHPSWRDDPRDFDWIRKMKREQSYMPQRYDFMSKLSLDQQIDVIAQGKELLNKWIGKYPIAHRSGGYSINDDTITALRKNNIPIDSSMNISHANSKITWSRNAVINRDGNILEIPVTVFSRSYEIFGIPIFQKLMKTDIDECSVHDLLEYVDCAEREGVKFLNLFFHSYSLLNFNRDFTRISADPLEVKKLRKLLTELRKRDYVRFVDSKDILTMYKENQDCFSGTDIIPVIPNNSEVVRLGKAKIKRRLFEYVKR